MVYLNHERGIHQSKRSHLGNEKPKDQFQNTTSLKHLQAYLLVDWHWCDQMLELKVAKILQK